jgi:hypothetical protein
MDGHTPKKRRVLSELRPVTTQEAAFFRALNIRATPFEHQFCFTKSIDPCILLQAGKDEIAVMASNRFAQTEPRS